MLKAREIERNSPQSIEIRKGMRAFKASNENFDSISIADRRAGFLQMMRSNYKA